MALSKDKKYLAVCERATRAVCVIYNVGRFLDTIRAEIKSKKH